MHPVIMDLLLANASTWGITHLRLTDEPFGIQKRAGRSPKWAHAQDAVFHCLLSWRVRARAQRLGIKTPAHVFGLFQTGRVTLDYLRALLPLIPTGHSEL
jgi:hypothetical protein